MDKQHIKLSKCQLPTGAVYKCVTAHPKITNKESYDDSLRNMERTCDVLDIKFQ